MRRRDFLKTIYVIGAQIVLTPYAFANSLAAEGKETQPLVEAGGWIVSPDDKAQMMRDEALKGQLKLASAPQEPGVLRRIKNVLRAIRDIFR